MHVRVRPEPEDRDRAVGWGAGESGCLLAPVHKAPTDDVGRAVGIEAGIIVNRQPCITVELSAEAGAEDSTAAGHVLVTNRKGSVGTTRKVREYT